MLKKTINTIIVLITIVFISCFLYYKFDYNALSEIKYNNLYLLLSLFVLSLYICFQSIIWSILVKILNPSVLISKSMMNWMLSQYGKYLPGKVGSYALLFYLYKDSPITNKELYISSYYELVCFSVANLITSLFLMVFIETTIFSQFEIYLLLLSTLVFFVCLYPKILNYILGYLAFFLKREKIEINLKLTTIVKLTILYCIGNVLLGISFYIFINSVSILKLTYLPFIIILINLSNLFGLFAFFVPAGIGAREGALIYFLKKIISFQVATMISIISRLWFIIAEFITLAIAYLYLKYFGHIDVISLINKSKNEIENQ